MIIGHFDNNIALEFFFHVTYRIRVTLLEAKNIIFFLQNHLHKLFSFFLGIEIIPIKMQSSFLKVFVSGHIQRFQIVRIVETLYEGFVSQ